MHNYVFIYMFIELFCERSITDKVDTICFTHWPFIFLMLFECLKNTRAPHAGANARLKLHLENSKSKKGHNFVKKIGG